jgi:flagellar biosynthetic protein FliO
MDSVAILPSFFKMIFALAAVLGLLVGAMYFFKRLLPQTSVRMSDHSLINIIATRYLGPKSSIMLLEVLGKVVVIGVSSSQISCLATISEADALERLKHSAIRDKCSPPSLTDYLRRNKIVIGVLHRFGKYGRKK